MSLDYYMICDGCKGAIFINHGRFSTYGREIGLFMTRHVWKCQSKFVVEDHCNDITVEDCENENENEILYSSISESAEKITFDSREEKILKECYDTDSDVGSHCRQSLIDKKRLTIKKILDQFENRITFLETSYKNSYPEIVEFNQSLIELSEEREVFLKVTSNIIKTLEEYSSKEPHDDVQKAVKE